jgi:hypothetical protein
VPESTCVSYGAFTHSHSQIDAVVKYVSSQEEHHKKSHSKRNILKYLRKTMLNLRRNTCLNSLMIFMVGIKYYGALHLWYFFPDVFLQIPACRQVGFAALLLFIQHFNFEAT